MKKIIYPVLALNLAFVSCHPDHPHKEEHHHDHEEEHHTERHAHKHEDIILSREQMETMDIRLGHTDSIKINHYIRATGTLGLPPNALTSLSPRAQGFIRNSNKYIPGDYIKRGEVMAYLENPEFIAMQQSYFETQAELQYAAKQLERQKKLLASNAGIEKNVEKLEAELASKTARLKGLEKQLAYIGIKMEGRELDKLIQSVPVYAPMSGYITSISMHNGMYVSPENELMEIVDESHLHLELDVFEKDISRIKEGQTISYTIPAMGDKVYKGTVHTLGKEFNPSNKTVRVHGHVEGERPPFIKELFLDARVWLDNLTAEALPESAIIRDGKLHYIYITHDQDSSDNLSFKAVQVIPGASEKGYTSLTFLDPLPEDARIVTKGAFYVYAQSQSDELRHSH